MQSLIHFLAYLDSLQDSNYFFTIFFATIIITRLSLLPKKRIVSPKIRGAHIHHYVYGIGLIILTFLIHSITLFAVGIGLFVDEIPMFATENWLFTEEDWHWDEYHSAKSLIILLFAMFLVYIFRWYLLQLLPDSVVF